MVAGAEFKSHGITSNTPKNVVLGAGTIHKGLKFTPTYAITEDETAQEGKTYYERTGSGEPYTYTIKEIETGESSTGLYERTGGSWNGAESIIGATSGGNTLTIEPEFLDIEADGALVKVKGLSHKIGETASLEVNMLEMTPEILQMATNGRMNSDTGIEGYSEITSNMHISEGDYIDDLGFVGKRVDGTPIIILFDNALCTSGLELGREAKEANVAAFTFECFANIEDVERLPWHIYYPTSADPLNTVEPTK